MVIVLIVLIYYIIDYFQNPKYTIQSFSHFNFKTKDQLKERENDKLYNPTINYTIELAYINYFRQEKKITNNFLLYDGRKHDFIDINSEFIDNISNFDYGVVYRCDDENCTNYDEYLKDFEKNKINEFYLYFKYQGFTLDHQNGDEPIKKNTSFDIYYKINLNSYNYIINHWRNILYSEKKQLFQPNYYDSCGYVESYNSYPYGRIIEYNPKDDKYYLVICEIEFNVIYSQYIEYRRTRVSELDLLANIFSLMANIFTGVRFVFSFYSGNFNNYKIIETILNKGQPKNFKYKPIEMNDLENNENKQFISIKDDLIENCIQKESNNDNIDTDKENKGKYIEEDEDKSSENTQRIKKMRFFDFFLNNFYFCFKKRKQQKIIHMCNEIIYEFASIDTLIKNQILLENLIKDYKWNDPSLNNVENNNLFIQLKRYL